MVGFQIDPTNLCICINRNRKSQEKKEKDFSKSDDNINWTTKCNLMSSIQVIGYSLTKFGNI